MFYHFDKNAGLLCSLTLLRQVHCTSDVSDAVAPEHLIRDLLANEFWSADERLASCGHMWHAAEFCRWLQNHGHEHLWTHHMVPQMKRLVEATLRCCQPHAVPRPGSCQVLGFDVMVDAACHVWLLEVNSSPTMEYSTPVTAELCAHVQEDTIKVAAPPFASLTSRADSCSMLHCCIG